MQHECGLSLVVRVEWIHVAILVAGGAGGHRRRNDLDAGQTAIVVESEGGAGGGSRVPVDPGLGVGGRQSAMELDGSDGAGVRDRPRVPVAVNLENIILVKAVFTPVKKYDILCANYAVCSALSPLTLRIQVCDSHALAGA